MPYNFVADSFHKRNFVADFLQAKCYFKPKTVVVRFRPPPLGDLEATYNDHHRLIGKRLVDFLLVLIELFSVGVTADTSDYWLKIGDFAPTGVG